MGRPLDVAKVTLPSGAVLRVPTPELPRYKGLAQRWHDCDDVGAVCAGLAAAMLDGAP